MGNAMPRKIGVALLALLSATSQPVNAKDRPPWVDPQSTFPLGATAYVIHTFNQSQCTVEISAGILRASRKTQAL